jgi:hypothetical protein
MTDQSRPKIGARKSNYAGISRRDVLRAGATIIPASIIVPAWLTANAQSTTTTFDYYISTTGSDSNPGTLASPWAITSLRTVSANFHLINGSGKRIGLLPGTYDISGLMLSNSPDTGALQIPGGTSGTPNYLGSSNASGNYSPRTATIDMKGASGLFGGGHSAGPSSWDGPGLAHCGQFPSPYTISNLTIDGVRFTGWSYRGLDIGAAYNADGPSGITNVLITNCEFTGGGFNPGDAEDNCAALWVQGGAGVTISNNWFHDSVGHVANSGDHFNAIIVWGPNEGPASTTYNTLIQYNTIVNAGNVYGKEIKVEGTTCQYNYLDVSNLTATSTGFQDFTGYNTGGLTRTSIFRNNIVLMQGNTVGGNAAFGWSTLSNDGTFTTPVQIYNNTIICTAGSAGPVVGWITATANGTGAMQWYNNIYVNRGSGGSWNGFGNFRTNPSAIKVMDYNLVPSSGVTWAVYQTASPTSLVASYSSLTAFNAGLASNGGIKGVEAHSLTGTPTFVGTGVYAAQYQLASGSAGKGAGSATGTSSGSATDMGAWGNGATQIGCNFAAPSGTVIPMAPALKSVT